MVCIEGGPKDEVYIPKCLHEKKIRGILNLKKKKKLDDELWGVGTLEQANPSECRR